MKTKKNTQKYQNLMFLDILLFWWFNFKNLTFKMFCFQQSNKIVIKYNFENIICEQFCEQF
jgi:hypothetical protein